MQSETTSYNIYKIPFHCLHKHKIKHSTLSKEDYILIASIGNESNKNTKPSLCIDDNLVNDIKQTMNVNVRGDGKKHFGSFGKYFGFGIVSKFSINNNMSFGVFASKKGK